jgi:hypothetical protein
MKQSTGSAIRQHAMSMMRFQAGILGSSRTAIIVCCNGGCAREFIVRSDWERKIEPIFVNYLQIGCADHNPTILHADSSSFG